MRLCCFTCGRSCSTIVPDYTVVRGTVTCSECEEKEVTALEKAEDGGWYYEGKPAHQVAIEKFLEGLKPGVVLKVIPAKK